MKFEIEQQNLLNVLTLVSNSIIETDKSLIMKSIVQISGTDGENLEVFAKSGSSSLNYTYKK